MPQLNNLIFRNFKDFDSTLVCFSKWGAPRSSGSSSSHWLIAMASRVSAGFGQIQVSYQVVKLRHCIPLYPNDIPMLLVKFRFIDIYIYVYIYILIAIIFHYFPMILNFLNHSQLYLVNFPSYPVISQLHPNYIPIICQLYPNYTP